MVDVLQRDITDLAAFHQALVEMRTGPPPLVAAFKGIFAQEPAFEPRFFSAILPTIQRLALRLPEVFPAEHRLPLLVPNQDGEVTLTQEQCAVVLASGFMGTLWVHPSVRSRFRFPGFKIQDLFTHKQGPSVAILRMVLHYFERLNIQMPQGKVTFRRQVLTAPPDWANSTKPLVPARVSNQGKIEDSDTTFHADFANQYIGGGVLHGGCVQEEILFAIKPECLVSMLFCAKMGNNEAIFITGAERFSDYRGYGHGLAFGGNYVDRTPRDDQGRIVTTIVAIDAVVAFGGVQWQEGAIVRDLNKVYCGCWEPQRQPGQVLPAFATGNWGCGAFGGDKSLKVLQQMMAAAEADREVLYHTFGEKYGDRSLKEWITLVNELILKHHPTVGEVYNLVRRCAPGPGEHRNVNLFAQLLHHYAAKEDEQQQEEVQKSAD
ncbi:poly(adpribose) glycohydrolase [Acanthamoeba castellanii str. Neff]|uniref:poly(ADP-ribose) glycohydrolase n=1 Tax=Acanthamoeba castellanii (strain ATCC 30010 / Neff) TaxID=1257118 RepID=L8GUS0_ACACF|nr:poly(adpribose) glycohydrolase [Acanthamoeba castellanii str. Neff]ELR16934.1 poly(adpribose) glycohydrolase [Acanthamoeba castellanii str. Neff]